MNRTSSEKNCSESSALDSRDVQATSETSLSVHEPVGLRDRQFRLSECVVQPRLGSTEDFARDRLSVVDHKLDDSWRLRRMSMQEERR